MAQQQHPSEPVVVTFDQVAKALGTEEAIGNLNEISQNDDTIPPVQRAAIMAGVGNVLEQIRLAEKAAGAKVLTTPHDERAARLQSLIASGEAAKLSFAALPTGGFEALFDTNDWFGWASVAWEKLKHLRPHDMIRPSSTAAAPFPDRGRMTILGDWGTGLYGAPKIAAAVKSDRDPIDLVLHLGDVYYSGTEKEVTQRFLEVWPRRAGAINRALNSNHEMYSGGDAYFDRTLPAFDQKGSYFAYQNAHWTLVGLDVAYVDHAIDDEQVGWLLEVVRNAGDRKIILFSHHQLYSSTELRAGRQTLVPSRVRRTAPEQADIRLVLGPRAPVYRVRGAGYRFRNFGPLHRAQRNASEPRHHDWPGASDGYRLRARGLAGLSAYKRRRARSVTGGGARRT